MIELLGWISSFFFAVCGAPQAWVCYRQGHGRGISALFMWIWLMGELFAFPYILLKYGIDLPILTNLTVNTFFIVVILRYVYFPREN